MISKSWRVWIPAVLALQCLYAGIASAEDENPLDGLTLVQIYNNGEIKNTALELGKAAFAEHCSSCHGEDATGSPGVPDMTSGIFLWGGSLSDMEVTTRYGIRSGHDLQRYSQMPAYTDQDFLSPDRINDLVEYVLDIAYREADKTAAARAADDFEQICSECHAYAGTGRQEYYGAPDLTDFIWQYGDSREALYESIANGRMGISPAFDGSLDNETIKALAIYVYDISHY